MSDERDDLEEYISGRAARDPELPARIELALLRRERLRTFGNERKAPFARLPDRP